MKKLKYIIFILIKIIVNFHTLYATDKLCIDADDFGFPKIDISSRALQTSDLFTNQDNQIIKWTSSNYQINGDKLTILVRNGEDSRWNSWYGDVNNISNMSDAQKTNVPACIFSNGGMCPNIYAKYAIIDNVANNDDGSSCYFEKGQGLYGLITSKDPNKDEYSLRNLSADSETFHLGENPNLFQDTKVGSNYSADPNDYEYEGAGGYDDIPKSRQGAQLYFKILDNYYDDNGGKYKLIIKSGVETIGLGVIAKVIKYVKEKFNDASESVFKRVVANSEYTFYIKLILILYIILNAIFFIFGITQITQSELAMHILKISIVLQLIATDTSWNFFYDTVFIFFQNGVDQIICIMTSENSTCNLSNSLGLFDKLLNILAAEETWKKAWSLVWTQWSGFILFIMIGISFILFVIAIFKAVIFYLLAYLATSILIILAPVFISFILFKFTKSLFDNWINQLFNYAIQPIVTFAGLSFWMTIIVTQIQRLLGFKVCVVGSKFDIPFYTAMPPHVEKTDLRWILAPGTYENYLNKDIVCDHGLKCGEDNSSMQELYDKIYDKDVTNQYLVEATCGPYECKDLRFPDLPYLQPYIPEDFERIGRIAGGEFVTISDILIFALLVGLMYLFNELVPEIGKAIAGVSGYSANLSSASKEAYGSIKSNASDAANSKYAEQLKTKGKEFANRAYSKTAKPYVDKFVDKAKGKVNDAKNAILSTKVGKGLAGAGGALIGLGSVVGSKAYELGQHGRLIASEGIGSYVRDRGRMGAGRRRRHEFFDKTGGKIDAVKDLGNAFAKDALYHASFGILGKSMKQDRDPETRRKIRKDIDRLTANYAHYFGLNDKQASMAKKHIDNISNKTASVGRWASTAAIASIFNPVVGGVIGAVGAVRNSSIIQDLKGLKDIKKTVKRDGAI